MINLSHSVSEDGAMIYLDTHVGFRGEDTFDLGFGYSRLSEIFFVPDIPNSWKVFQGDYPPPEDAFIGCGILNDLDAVMPDVFWYGSWGLTRENGWADTRWISDTDGGFHDSAVMLKWYQRTVLPGDSVRFTTYCGIQTPIEANLHITAIEPDIVPGCLDDEITPFNLGFTIESFFPFGIDTMELELIFSPDCAFLVDDSTRRTICEFDSGATFSEEWLFDYTRECRGNEFAGTLFVWADTLETITPFSFLIPEASDLEVEVHAEFDAISLGDTAVIHIYTHGTSTSLEYFIEPEDCIVYSDLDVIKAVPEESTIFNLVVSDDHGCNIENSIPIYVSDGELLAIAGSDAILCYGESIILGGLPSALGGTPPYSYLWTPLDYLTNPTSPYPLAFPTESISYTLQVTDSHGDTSTSEITLLVSPEIIADAGDDILAELDETITLGGSPTGSGGYGELSYSWSPARGLDDRYSPNPTLIVDRDITYTVHITDENLCETTDEINISIRDDIKESIDKPISPVLAQNSPNPFNPVTRIDYSLPKAADIRLDVFDIMGNRIATLANGHHNSGDFSAIFDATEQPGGVYFYRLFGEGIDEMRKMVFVK